MTLGWCDKGDAPDPNILLCIVSSSCMWDSKLSREWSGSELLALQGFDHDCQQGEWKSSELKDFAGEAFNGWTIAPVLIAALAHLPEAQALLEKSRRCWSHLAEAKADDSLPGPQFVPTETYTKQFGNPDSKVNTDEGHHMCVGDGMKGAMMPSSDIDGTLLK